MATTKSFNTFLSLLTLWITAANFISPASSFAFQDLECWDGGYYTGQNLHLVNYAPDFGALGFEAKATSCKVTGLWILYEYEEYNRYKHGKVRWLFGENYGIPQFPLDFDNRARSARFAGDPIDIYVDSVNLYETDYFTGEEHYYFADDPALNPDNLGASVIVTGCSRWAVFEYDNFVGRSACLTPGYEGETGECEPAFYPRNDTINYLGGRISSVKKGCDNDEHIIFPDALNTELKQSIEN